ncbi:hypothetical protein [Streptomyces albipurpureus]|uniref:Uncharacterized protein n=1 Tax=Streptomyces albipurpureus TaxID=2897419 RepID=A0ABT0ULH2_9ACTN|nr:hypothetical protein [Streptomyces sp. CWNU-1]MCM2389264.1 hypothetical protein [Streptomyces sp. CWNU-1]
MTRPSRMEIEVRRMLETRPAPIPAGLSLRAAARGARLLRRRRVVRGSGWLLLVALVLVFTVWMAVAQPWDMPPAKTTPPVDDW